MSDADDEVLSLPDQENIDQKIKELLENDKKEKENKRAGSEDKIHENISQNFILKEDIGKPLDCNKLASILEKFYVDKSDEDKTKFLLKQYNKTKTCDKVIVSHCNQHICSIYLSPFQRSTDISLQTIFLYIVKASYATFHSCDKLMFVNNEASKNIRFMVVDSVAPLGLSSVEINSLRGDLMKYRLPVHLRRLVKDVPSDSKFLFRDDIQRRISQILASNSALQK